LCQCSLSGVWSLSLLRDTARQETSASRGVPYGALEAIALSSSVLRTALASPPIAEGAQFAHQVRDGLEVWIIQLCGATASTRVADSGPKKRLRELPERRSRHLAHLVGLDTRSRVSRGADWGWVVIVFQTVPARLFLGLSARFLQRY